MKKPVLILGIVGAMLVVGYAALKRHGEQQADELIQHWIVASKNAADGRLERASDGSDNLLSYHTFKGIDGLSQEWVVRHQVDTAPLLSALDSVARIDSVLDLEKMGDFGQKLQGICNCDNPLQAQTKIKFDGSYAADISLAPITIDSQDDMFRLGAATGTVTGIHQNGELNLVFEPSDLLTQGVTSNIAGTALSVKWNNDQPERPTFDSRLAVDTVSIGDNIVLRDLHAHSALNWNDNGIGEIINAYGAANIAADTPLNAVNLNTAISGFDAESYVASLPAFDAFDAALNQQDAAILTESLTSLRNLWLKNGITTQVDIDFNAYNQPSSVNATVDFRPDLPIYWSNYRTVNDIYQALDVDINMKLASQVAGEAILGELPPTIAVMLGSSRDGLDINATLQAGTFKLNGTSLPIGLFISSALVSPLPTMEDVAKAVMFAMANAE
ncbi:MAG: hypothetical protein HWE20_16425 [Gammaproteobacteria bacterium]|nr:hypothetical protein [Gammaproteobacteria bacterium]